MGMLVLYTRHLNFLLGMCTKRKTYEHEVRHITRKARLDKPQVSEARISTHRVYAMRYEYVCSLGASAM